MARAGMNRERLRQAAAAAALLALAAYCIARYRDALLAFFFLDDFWLLRDAAAFHAAAFPRDAPLDLVRLLHPTHAGFGLYRPVTQSVYFAALWPHFGCDATPYHAVQLLAFTANALLVFGIARRLTGSMAAALAAGLIYATTPGHITAVFWLAAFTMTGTALVVLAMLWCWLRIETPWWRAVVCTVLQAIGLLASEHAVTGPGLLALMAWGAPRGEPWRRRLRLLLPSIGMVVAYVAIKLWYLTTTDNAVARPYVPTLNLGFWLMDAGEYLLGAINVVMLQRPERGSTAFTVGILLVALLAVAAWRSRHGRRGWQVLAIGIGVFLVALLPVLPLPWHFYDYFVGIAALGVALAILGVCQLLGGRFWSGAALALAAGLVLFDVISGQAAPRSDRTYRLAVGGAASAVRWITAVQATHAPRVRQVTVPANDTTQSVFGLGKAETVFPSMPRLVSLHPPYTRPPKRSLGPVVVHGPAAVWVLSRDLPCWTDRWDWLRDLAR
jgi:4-amino-4-deoxy-L-arabinose transferase-like glycosyltransferase